MTAPAATAPAPAPSAASPDALPSLLPRSASPGALTTPPAWLCKAEVAVLMGALGRAFGVRPPTLAGLSAAQALALYREFGAGCMEVALEDADVADHFSARLGREARRLGRMVRLVVPPPLRRRHVPGLLRYLYRGVGIGLRGTMPGDVVFGPCAFARSYTPADCGLMSAFDEGLMCGMLGMDATLRFSCRLTEGATCCRANLTRKRLPLAPDGGMPRPGAHPGAAQPAVPQPGARNCQP